MPVKLLIWAYKSLCVETNKQSELRPSAIDVFIIFLFPVTSSMIYNLDVGVRI